MTCKDCIHSGLCYKENDYENFPDRCGSFISDKVLKERPQGKWIDGYCNKCGGSTLCDGWGRDVESRFCPNCGAEMKGGKE